MFEAQNRDAGKRIRLPHAIPLDRFVGTRLRANATLLRAMACGEIVLQRSIIREIASDLESDASAIDPLGGSDGL